MTTATTDQTVDYEHFIDYQLTRAQARIKGVEIGTAVVRLLTAAIAYVLGIIALDHALILPSGVRLALLLLFLAGAAAYFAWAVIMPSVRRLNSLYAARTIENATPEFKNSLINFLDLRRRADNLPPGVLDALEERAVADLSGIQVEEKINQDRLIRASYELAAIVFATCLAVIINAMFMHRSLGDSIARALLPVADVAPPTKTRLTDIRPGDDVEKSTIVALEDVEISAIVEGRVPDRVLLHRSDDAGRFWHEQELVKPEGLFDPWRLKLPMVERPFEYYLSAGDFRSKRFVLNVNQPPLITELEVTYEYPEYTGWDRQNVRNGNIDALEGTNVTLTAKTSRPARTGQLKFGPNKSPGPMMQVAPGGEQMTARFQVTQNDTYTIWFETERGETNPRPASYEIRVRHDMAPKLTMKPGTDQVDPPVPANSLVPIGINASDDFGLEQITLHVGQGHETLRSWDLTDGQSAGREFDRTHRLDLAELRLESGDEITYWVHIADNRQPRRNTVESTRYRIRVGSPLPPAEREQELARAKEAEKAAEEATQPDPPAETETTMTPGESDEPPNQENSETQIARDDKALEVIRKYLEEQDQQEGERPREPGQMPESKPGEEPPPDEASKSEGEEKSGDAKKDADNSEAEKQKQEADATQKSATEKEKGAAEKSTSPDEQSKEQSTEKSEASKPSNDDKMKKSDDKSEQSEASKKGESGGDQSSSDQKPTGKDDKAGDMKSQSSDQQPEGESKSDKPQPGERNDKGEKKPAGDSEMKSDKPAEPGAEKDQAGDKDSAASKSDKPGDDPKSQSQHRPGESTKEKAEKTDQGDAGKSEKGQNTEPTDTPPEDAMKSEREKSARDDSRQPAEQTKKTQNGKQASEQSKQDQQETMPSEKSEGDDPKSAGEKESNEKPSGTPQKGASSKEAKDQQTGKTGKSAGDKPAGDQAAEKPGDSGQQSDDSPRDSGKESDAGKSGEQKSSSKSSKSSQKSGDGKGADGKSSGNDSQGEAGKSSATSKGSGKAKGSQGQGGSEPGEGGQSPDGERTEKPQPGAGENRGEGRTRPNDGGTVDQSPEPDEPNMQYTREGSELVLQRLSEQLDRGEVDPELLRRLGWTRQELEQFVRDFSGPGATQDDGSKFDKLPPGKKPAEAGKTTLRAPNIRSVRRGPGQTAQDSLGENVEGTRLKPPPEYEEHVKAYNMSQSKNEPAKPQPATKPK